MLATFSGCIGGGESSGVEHVWGRRGISEGRLQKPRAIAIDQQDRLYIVDMTARIQVFDRDGNFLRGWRTPEWENGKPVGLDFSNDGNLLVADTHYFRMLVYTPEGKLLEERTIGGECGNEPGQFNFVTDAVQDSAGNYYIAEYGPIDRVQKFTPEGEFVYQWGSHGREVGQFMRPQALAIDENDHLWIADSCNHRICVYDVTGEQPELVRVWGEQGYEPGQMRYPYGMVLDGQGHVYVSEYGNHRVQKFTLEGESLGCWGVAGRGEGELNSSWSLIMDSKGRLHVLDSLNHRVQRIVL
jgi:sugar lactone lactonase YvrE